VRYSRSFAPFVPAPVPVQKPPFVAQESPVRKAAEDPFAILARFTPQRMNETSPVNDAQLRELEDAFDLK